MCHVPAVIVLPDLVQHPLLHLTRTGMGTGDTERREGTGSALAAEGVPGEQVTSSHAELRTVSRPQSGGIGLKYTSCSEKYIGKGTYSEVKYTRKRPLENKD